MSFLGVLVMLVACHTTAFHLKKMRISRCLWRHFAVDEDKFGTIIPYDDDDENKAKTNKSKANDSKDMFAREEKSNSWLNLIPSVKLDEKKSINSNKQSININNDEVVTGYGNQDIEDEEEFVPPSVDIDPNESPFLRFLKDTYIGTPYDSKSKKQARYIIRNITLISVSIGVIFTVIWYAFPGKFISYKGDTDFSSRYEKSYIDPSDLLQIDDTTDTTYFDENIPLPDTNLLRVPYEKSLLPRAPFPSQEI